jgi:hypothetical protein
MSQAVSHRPFTAETLVSGQFGTCGICGGQIGTRTGSSPNSSVSPVNMIPSWLSILLYHLGNEQQAR